jgi:hypothetical protein
MPHNEQIGTPEELRSLAAETRKKVTGNKPNLPTYVRPEWLRWMPDLNLLFRLLAGTRTMWQHVREYIRQWRDEDNQVYWIRSRSEQLFEGLGRTLSAAIGMLFAKPPAVVFPEGSAAKGEMEPHFENIDGAGTNFNVFVKRFTEASLRDGDGLILVDFPTGTLDQETGLQREVSSAEEEELGLRPTWARYDRANIRNWQTGRFDNQDVITQVNLYEPVFVADGRFGVRWEHRWRFLHMAPKLANPVDPSAGAIGIQAQWSLIRLLPDKSGDEPEDFQTIGQGVFMDKDGGTFDRLPIAIAYTGKKNAPLVAVPPLLGVAWANLGLWQIATNVRFYLDLVSFPQPTIIGDLAQTSGYDENGIRISVPGKLKIGPMVAVHLTAGDADSPPSSYTFTTPTADGFVPNENAMRRKREDIAALGMSFLDRDKRAAETAEAKRLDATAENATLATAAQGIDDAVDEAMRVHAQYLGFSREESPTVTLNRDFDQNVMDAQMMSAWISGVEKAGLPPRILLEAWKAGGQIPDGVDLEELEQEMLANQAAKEAEEQMERERQLALMTTPTPTGEEDG